MRIDGSMSQVAKRVFLKGTKTDRARVVPISRTMVAALKSQRAMQAADRLAIGAHYVVDASAPVFTTSRVSVLRPKLRRTPLPVSQSCRSCRRHRYTLYVTRRRRLSSAAASTPVPRQRSSAMRTRASPSTSMLTLCKAPRPPRSTSWPSGSIVRRLPVRNDTFSEQGQTNGKDRGAGIEKSPWLRAFNGCGDRI